MYIDPTTNQVIEEFEDEILNSFAKADWEQSQPVDVIYIIDSHTGKDLELWRKDYPDLAKSLN